MLKLIIVFLITNFLSSTTFASVWPVFSPPDKEFLYANEYITATECGKEKGKLRAGIIIPVRLFCKTYCPDNWTWQTMSDGNCHNLKTDFRFKSYNINYVRDQDGATLYSIVTAIYGNTNTDIYALTFITPKNYWYCYEASAEMHTVICGNDVSKNLSYTLECHNH